MSINSLINNYSKCVEKIRDLTEYKEPRKFIEIKILCQLIL